MYAYLNHSAAMLRSGPGVRNTRLCAGRIPGADGRTQQAFAGGLAARGLFGVWL
jgi:hypothetical protein